MEDYVLMEFPSHKRNTTSVLYVGFVKEALGDNMFRVKFLSQYNNRRAEFHFPNVDQIEDVVDDKISRFCPVL